MSQRFGNTLALAGFAALFEELWTVCKFGLCFPHLACR